MTAPTVSTGSCRAVSYPSSHASAGMWTEISIASMSSDVGMIALRKAVPT